MAKMKKYQGGGTMDPKVAEFLRKRQAADTTKPYNREDMFERVNKQTMAEMKNPALGDERRRVADSTARADWKKAADAERAYHKKEGNKIEDRPSGSTVYTIMPKKKSDGFKKGGKIKKAKAGGSFPDLNKDGKITKADILKGRGVIAKKGAKVKAKAKPCMNCGGKMKSGGKAKKK